MNTSFPVLSTDEISSLAALEKTTKCWPVGICKI